MIVPNKPVCILKLGCLGGFSSIPGCLNECLQWGFRVHVGPKFEDHFFWFLADFPSRCLQQLRIKGFIIKVLSPCRTFLRRGGFHNMCFKVENGFKTPIHIIPHLRLLCARIFWSWSLSKSFMKPDEISGFCGFNLISVWTFTSCRWNPNYHHS